jgi:hypothetical protein
MNGTASVGTETKVARGDHVHPTDTSRASQAALDELAEVVAGKAAGTHSHSISEVTNLQAQLDTKATTSALETHTKNADIHFTAAERTKLEGIAIGATKVTVDSDLSGSSTNPVQNKVVNSAIITATEAISANTKSITALESVIAEIQEITSADIQGLFSK